jgi:hypothetical protein
MKNESSGLKVGGWKAECEKIRRCEDKKIRQKTGRGKIDDGRRMKENSLETGSLKSEIGFNQQIPAHNTKRATYNRQHTINNPQQRITTI